MKSRLDGRKDDDVISGESGNWENFIPQIIKMGLHRKAKDRNNK